MRRVVVHIHTLRLTGIERSNSRAIAEGLREELANALAKSRIAPAIAPNHRSVARLSLGRVRLTHNATPHRLGALVGRSVAAGVAS